MEALFSGSLASYEAWLMFISVVVFIAIFFFDGVNFIRRVIALFTPQEKILVTEVPAEGDIPEVPVTLESPMLEKITRAEIRAHEKEKEQETRTIEAAQEEANAIEEEILETIEQYGVDAELIETIEERNRASHEQSLQEESVTIDIPEQVTDEEDALSDEEKEDVVEEVEDTRETEESIQEESEKEDVLEKSEDTLDAVESIVQEESEKEETQESPEENTSSEEEDASEKSTDNSSDSAPKTRTENQHTEQLYAITNEVKTLIARGNTTDARALIIQGLSLNKDHRELNLILGSLYESERQYTKAEYVYKDLALIYEDDIEILEKLANILIVEKRYDLAMEIYKRITILAGETEGSLYIMSHLARELDHPDELLQYTKKYQKNWPNNPEILSLLAEAEIALGNRQAAIQTLIKLKNLTPYNADIVNMIQKLTAEEEMANNFGN